MTNRILIALQFWEGDKWQADALARYLADLETKHTDLADFLLVHRNDCELPRGIAEYLSRKFNTFVYRAPKGMTGWPAGCNSLWSNTTQWVQTMMHASKIPQYKAIFVCESDGAPVFQDWVLRMSQAWDAANKPKPVCVAGPVVQIPAEHMNGNLMMSGEPTTLRWLARLSQGVSARVGWDFVLSKEFKRRGWANIPGMLSLYNTRDYTVERFLALREAGVIWVHGVKDLSLIEHGRNLLIERL